MVLARIRSHYILTSLLHSSYYTTYTTLVARVLTRPGTSLKANFEVPAAGATDFVTVKVPVGLGLGLG